MRKAIRRWEASGLSMKAFAEGEDIAYSTFQYWRRRLEQEPSFVPVTVVEEDDDPEADSVIEIETRNGLVVRIPRDLEEGELRRLVGVLSEC